MSRGDPHWSEPIRTRSSVRQNANHLGYLTTVSYPHRDLTAFPEGSPYSEVVVSDLNEKHVALFQRFKQHWLIHCGNYYRTTESAGELRNEQVLELAVFALSHQDKPALALVAHSRRRSKGC
ncbi:MAG: hypothetical protein L0241_10370 [Planctomycetia bacterium]|nr:hypothetical protein [Planctomycetia bacterium]